MSIEIRFFYKVLPFWLASLIYRVHVVVLPLLVIVLPATHVAPSLFRWRVRSRICRWYGALMALEREMMAGGMPGLQLRVGKHLDAIEHTVNEMRTPPSFADQLYVLRGHVAMCAAASRAGTTRPEPAQPL